MSGPLVSVLCITYNHEQFIKDALVGFASQVTNFEYEIVISDDCSTDSTVENIKSIASKLDLKVKLNVQDRNVGVYKNFHSAYKLCTGQYIAICDGDDFWVSSKKLQKQVDILENNANAIAVYHQAHIVNEHGNISGCVPNKGKNYSSLKDYFQDFYKIPTCSVMFKDVFRQDSLFKYRRLLPGRGYILDYLIDALLCSKGVYYFIDEVLSSYRVTHGTNSFSSQKVLSVSTEMLSTRSRLNYFFGSEYSKYIKISSDIVRMSIFIKILKQDSVVSAISFFLSLSIHEKIGLFKQMARYWKSEK